MLLVVIALLIVLIKKIPRPGNASLVPSVIQTFFVPLPDLPPYHHSNYTPSNDVLIIGLPVSTSLVCS